jgi:hypothetical protein
MKMGRQLFGFEAATRVMDRRGFYGSHRLLRCSMEPRKALAFHLHAALHRLRLESRVQISFSPIRQAPQDPGSYHQLAPHWSLIHIEGSCQLAWQASPRRMYLSANQTFPSFNCSLHHRLPFTTSTPVPIVSCPSRSTLDSVIALLPPKFSANHRPFPGRYRMVGRCKYFLWNRSRHRKPLVCVVLGTRFQSRTQAGFRYRLGRGCSSRTRAPSCSSFGCHFSWLLREEPLPCSIRQRLLRL